MFSAIALSAVGLCQVFFVWFLYGALRYNWRWVDRQSLSVYTDAAKTLITSSGIAVAIVVAGLRGDFKPPTWMLKTAIVLLITCILSAVAFMVVLARAWEAASSSPEGDGSQGKLSWPILIVILIFADVALTSFLLGFIYLGRTVFWI